MVMSTLGQRPNTVPMYTALAISADGGRSFTKPMLGLVDLGDGGKNNVIWPLEPQTKRAGGDHQTGTVFIDEAPGVPPEEKYKMTGLWLGVTMAMASPDGIHFTVMDKGPPSSGCAKGSPKGCIYTGSDTQQVAFWDKKLGKYAAYRRNWPAVRPHDIQRSCVGSNASKHCGGTYTGGRMVGRCLSDRLDSFQGCDHNETICVGASSNCTFRVLAADDADAKVRNSVDFFLSFRYEIRPFAKTGSRHNKTQGELKKSGCFGREDLRHLYEPGYPLPAALPALPVGVPALPKSAGVAVWKRRALVQPHRPQPRRHELQLHRRRPPQLAVRWLGRRAAYRRLRVHSAGREMGFRNGRAGARHCRA